MVGDITNRAVQYLFMGRSQKRREISMKTDAVVLLELIEEIREKHPANDKATYTMLAAFQKDAKGINIISLINECCGRLRQFVDIIPNTTEVHRIAFVSAIKNFEDTFSVRNMGVVWRQFLEQLENPKHNQALHFLDYLIQSQPFWKQRELNLPDVASLLDELENVISKIDVPPYLKSIIKSDIAKLRYILKNYDRFGEQDYWSKFQKVTGLFGSIYTTLDDEHARKRNLF